MAFRISYNHLPKSQPKELRTDAVAQRCSVKKFFLKIFQNSQENTCASSLQLYLKNTLAQVFSCEFCDLSINTFSYITPSMAAFVSITVWKSICF